MGILHTPEFREQALEKAFSRGSRDVASVARELNMNHLTLKGWMKEKNKRDRLKAANALELAHNRRPHDWTTQEQFLALMQTHSLSDEDRNAWCRERGLFAYHLVEWQNAFTNSAANTFEQQEFRGLKDENQQLKRELLRKEKALAEAAALLVLQKKFRAMWEDEAK
jgi:transposase-like protein